MRAGLEVLRSLPGTTWLVLADMAELGEHTSDSHAQHRQLCARLRRQAPVRVRDRRARARSRPSARAREWFADVDSLIRRLQAELAPGVTVLIKGSRVNRLERVVQAL